MIALEGRCVKHLVQYRKEVAFITKLDVFKYSKLADSFISSF